MKATTYGRHIFLEHYGARLSISFPMDGVRFLTGLFTPPKKRNTGYATKLLEEAKKRANAEHTALELEYGAFAHSPAEEKNMMDDQQLVDFYRRKGFHIVNEEEHRMMYYPS